MRHKTGKATQEKTTKYSGRNVLLTYLYSLYLHVFPYSHVFSVHLCFLCLRVCLEWFCYFFPKLRFALSTCTFCGFPTLKHTQYNCGKCWWSLATWLEMGKAPNERFFRVFISFCCVIASSRFPVPLFHRFLLRLCPSFIFHCVCTLRHFLLLIIWIY